MAEPRLNNAPGFLLLLTGPPVVGALASCRRPWPRTYAAASAAAALACGAVAGIENATGVVDSPRLVVFLGTWFALSAVALAAAVLPGAAIAALRTSRPGHP